MRGRFLGCVVLFSLASCSGSREPTGGTPIVALNIPSSTPSATPIAISSASPAASAAPSANAPVPDAATMPSASATAVAGPPPSYPEEWLSQARADNMGLSCFELVYKNGCSQTRTGTIIFQVTIDDNGSVAQFSEVDNQIHHDKAVVSRCLKKNLPRWKFHPPEGHQKTFQIGVTLADRC